MKVNKQYWHKYLTEIDQSKKGYAAYRKSLQWSRLVKQVLERDKSCVICNSTKSAVVHHRTYADIGRESLDQLVRLCKRCHMECHRFVRIPHGSRK